MLAVDHIQSYSMKLLQWLLPWEPDMIRLWDAVSMDWCSKAGSGFHPYFGSSKIAKVFSFNRCVFNFTVSEHS